MTTVALTGAGGFLGWHTRAALLEQGIHTGAIPLGSRFDASSAAATLEGTSRVLHLAGVNRADPEQVRQGNIRFAEQLAEALARTDDPPAVVVYANSIQAGNDSPYGQSKQQAAQILATAAARVGARFIDLVLPHLFGEHGRPFYNAVTSTFCHILASGGTPEVAEDKELTLLHAQHAAELLIGSRDPATQGGVQVVESVSGLLRRLSSIAGIYRLGEIPDLSDPFERDLFNTYRSHTFPSRATVPLQRHSDPRGSFFEMVRCHGGTGQSAFSTTAPGVSRGDHFHRRKVERFTVVHGQATISLRRLFSTEAHHLEVSGDRPVAVDMPTMWAHRIVNTGQGDLFTAFWSNDLFDPTDPDTTAEVV